MSPKQIRLFSWCGSYFNRKEQPTRLPVTGVPPNLYWRERDSGKGLCGTQELGFFSFFSGAESWWKWNNHLRLLIVWHNVRNQPRLAFQESKERVLFVRWNAIGSGEEEWKSKGEAPGRAWLLSRQGRRTKHGCFRVILPSYHYKASNFFPNSCCLDLALISYYNKWKKK